MLTRTIPRARLHEDTLNIQYYNYSIQDSFLQYRRNNPYNNFLRKQFLTPSDIELFLNPAVPSASTKTDFLPIDEDGEFMYKLRKEYENVGLVRVKHYPNCTHILSQLCLESQGYVNKKWAKETLGNKFIADKWNQHEDVQRYFMNSGFADAVELPLSHQTEGTAFVDMVYRYKGVPQLMDYKPECMSAKNKHAVAQILFQQKLFKLMTGMDSGGGYFDEQDCVIII